MLTEIILLTDDFYFVFYLFVLFFGGEFQIPGLAMNVSY